jgi:hypothetical protein
MWMLFVMDGNKQEGKWLVIEHKAIKWVKDKCAPPKGSPWQNSHGKWGDYDITFMITMIIKQGDSKS